VANEDLAKLKIDKSGDVYNGRRKRRIRPWAAGVIIAAISLGIYSFVFNPGASVELASVSLVYPTQTFTVLNASGYVVAQRKAAVSSKATGRLEWLGVEEGSRVKRNEVIARLEDRDVKAGSEQAAANLESAHSSLAQARAELQDAMLNYSRSKDLLAKGFVAQMDYDTAEARYRRAQAAVSGAESAIKAAEAAFRATEVAVEYTLIRAPFDAVVLTKDADVGDIVTPFGAAVNARAAVVTIADLSSLQVEADVSESNLAKVKVGQPCELQLDAFPDQRFKGAVHMIVPTADRSKASVMVKVLFQERDLRILPEMSAKVAFLEREAAPGEELPRIALNPKAVVAREGGHAVFLVEGDRVKEVPVRLGGKIGDMIEALEGVRPGDKVVVNPPKKLKDGMRITVKEG
jgi:RND family efflux transporter MFP subunit